MGTLLIYQMHQYLKSNKFVMPLIVLMALLFCNYSVRPAVYIDCLMLSVILVFAVMTWIGGTLCSLEPEVSEQLILLRLQKRRAYGVSCIFLQLILSFVVAVLAILVPVVQDVRSSNSFFLEKINVMDVCGGFLLLFSAAFAGSASGGMSHYRLLRERKTAVSFTFLLFLLSVLKGIITKSVPAAKVVLWVLPPVWDAVMLSAKAVHLTLYQTVLGSGMLLLSGILYSIVKMEILGRKGF